MGGLVGFLRENVENSYATGEVNGGDRVGGLVGFSVEGDVENSYATGNVTGENYVGGLVGTFSDETEGIKEIVRNSYATGNVRAETYAGGLVGKIWENGATIENTFSTGLGMVTK